MTADKPLGHDYRHDWGCGPNCTIDYCSGTHCQPCGKPKADHEPAMVPAEDLTEAKQRLVFAEAEVTRWRNQAVKEAEECKGWKAKAEELAKAESIATGWRESAQGWRALAEAGEKKAIDSHMALMDLIVKTRVASGDAGQIMAGDAALRKVMDAECRKANGEGFEECREAAEKAAREHFGLVADADTRFGLIARLRGLVPK